MGADMVLYGVLALSRDFDVDDIRVLEVLNQRVAQLSESTLEQLTDEPWFENLPEAEDLSEALGGGSSAYRSAALEEIRSAIQHTAAKVFLGSNRDIATFVDSDERTWLLTGGVTHGDPPTESCEAIQMLHRLGISNERIQVDSSTDLGVPRCPQCTDSYSISAVEHLTGTARIEPKLDAAPGQQAWGFSGRTEINWDGSQTTAWRCSCGWESADERWIDPFTGPTSDDHD